MAELPACSSVLSWPIYSVLTSCVFPDLILLRPAVMAVNWHVVNWHSGLPGRGWGAFPGTAGGHAGGFLPDRRRFPGRSRDCQGWRLRHHTVTLACERP